jgi:S1-C subfamily serine protease
VSGASLKRGAGGPNDELTGVRVVDLKPDGVAASLGLEEEDLILSVADEKVSYPERCSRKSPTPGPSARKTSLSGEGPGHRCRD